MDEILEMSREINYNNLVFNFKGLTSPISFTKIGGPMYTYNQLQNGDTTFNGVYSRDNLPNKIKDGAYVINLDEYSNIGTHWIALYVKNNNITKEITKFINRPSSSVRKIKILRQIFSVYKHMIQ